MEAIAQVREKVLSYKLGSGKSKEDGLLEGSIQQNVLTTIWMFWRSNEVKKQKVPGMFELAEHA